MTRNLIVAAALIALGGILATGLTALRPAMGKPADEPGRYRVAASQSSYVLFDSLSGTSWIMTPKPDAKRSAWLPTQRLNSEAEVKLWELQNRPRE